MSVEALRAKAANTGPALFFPDPEVPAIYNFDQGLAAPETYPVEDLTRLAKQVLDSGTISTGLFRSQGRIRRAHLRLPRASHAHR